ncbi:hypothetical protein Vadar_026389 [Vaccinium darrowii]|uniref:Uncharacterized protein n=1 Tax=Vaccinium darrowii TaxID=229202 RepID=A0ACB7ZEG7_9ERIC|nr:hypothetical protein Vadar_026389 [Vaccinium darrowii]
MFVTVELEHAGSTLEVRSATGMNPFPVASGAVESYRRIFENRIAETHGFQASLRLTKSLDDYWQGG